MERYVLLKDGAEIASANRCRNAQAVLFALLMVAQANDRDMEGMSWELPEAQSAKIGKLYSWDGSRHDTLYGLPIRWVGKAKEA